jgi:hypothetical protein
MACSGTALPFLVLLNDYWVNCTSYIIKWADDQVGIWKGTVVTHMKILSQHESEGTEENCEEPRSGSSNLTEIRNWCPLTINRTAWPLHEAARFVQAFWIFFFTLCSLYTGKNESGKVDWISTENQNASIELITKIEHHCIMHTHNIRIYLTKTSL